MFLILKLLRIINSLNPSSGGPAEGILQISPHLSQLGVRTTVLCFDLPGSPWLNNLPYDHHAFGPVRGNYGYKKGLPSIIRRLAVDQDFVIVEGIWQYHSFATWRALRNTKIPYYVYTHGMLDPWFKYTYPIKHLKKWAYWPWAEYRVLRDAQGVLFTTELERDLARKSFWLYKAHEKVLGYGTSIPPDNIESQKQKFFDTFPHLEGQRILLFLSRIHPKKGIDILIEAFSSIASEDDSLRLVIAGPDQLGIKKSLYRRSVQLGIDDRITWTGMLSGDLKWGAFRCSELFCLPSHQENFGVVVAEALACGVPVAISEPVNISIEVRKARAGFVFKDNVDSTKNSLLQWLSLSIEQKAIMKSNARKLFKERFEMSRVALQIRDFLLTFNTNN